MSHPDNPYIHSRQTRIQMEMQFFLPRVQWPFRRPFPMILCLTFIMIMWGLPNPAPSQGENNLWYFGDSAGVDFSTTPPTALFNKFYSHEACATICDRNGNLLFYTNNKEVYDRNHNVMPNGTGLMGDHSNAQTLAIRQPGSSNIYYIFTTDNAELTLFQMPTGFRYSIVDLNQNNGLGDVVVKNHLILDSATEKIAAIPHANGCDYWILMHEIGSNGFRAYVFTCSGFDTNFVASNIGGIHYPFSMYKFGILKASPDGKFVAQTIPWSGRIELFKFDRKTGILDSAISLYNLFDMPFGLEFSSDGTKLYVCNADAYDKYDDVYQFDISNYIDSAVYSSFDSLNYSGPKYSYAGLLQSGPDDKIYIVRSDTNFLAVINSPDSPAAVCQFLNYGLQLVPGTVDTNQGASNLGLPHWNWPRPEAQIYLSEKFSCEDDTVNFSSIVPYQADSVSWDFGDPASGAANVSKSDSIYHIYTTPGTFIVTFLSHTKCETDTTRDTVSIGPASLTIPDTAICNMGGVKLDAGNPGKEYLWSTGDTTQSIFIGNPGNYSVSVTDSSGCIAFDTALVTLDIPASANYGFDTSGCPSVQFSDSSSGNPLAWKWYFGDGDSSGLQSPNHTYNSNGMYQVTLIVSDNCGSDTLTVTLYVDCIENRNEQVAPGYSMLVFPNPNSGEFTVEIRGGNNEIGNLSVHNVLGQLIGEYPVQIPGIQKINLNSQAAGVYGITLVTERGRMRVKVVKGQ